ncbi:MAG TPA: SoxR reducing system RseC family protein [Candidatus Wunengus californicus]|uniref:SoxR reducing system RseC family protein n=1 Tax=Candidatus Wunengus californicus TaxID=3367619 RepID=UPI004029FA29|nr:SoxR reducing system RseC family protein [Planctomycetota bacterium]
MQIRGKVVSISGDFAEVCIIRENTACGSCSTCLKKMGVRDITKVAAIKGIQIGQEVVLRDNITWFLKNRIMLVLVAFVSGIIVTEAAATIVSFGTYRGAIDLLVGGILTLIVLVVSWVKKPRYLFKIEQIEGGRT